MSRPVDRAVVARVGARMLVIDPDDRVLLIEEAGHDPDAGDWHHWLTPGGGVEAGEALTAAATREVIEETGLRIELAPDDAPIHRQRRRWSWAGVTHDQLDHIFAVRVGAPFDVRPTALTEMEQQTVAGGRWWTLDELRATEAVLIPPDLPDVLAQSIARPLTRPVARTAGRVLVLDPQDRLLLIETTNSSSGGTTTHWIAPGGGVEPDESPADAATRELAEETGIVAAALPAGPAVHTERAVFAFLDGRLDQTDHYFLLRLDHVPPIDTGRLTDLERTLTVAYRWWTCAELRTTSLTYWPADLVAVLDRIASGRA